MIQISLSQTTQIKLCTNCPLAECREGTDACPLVIEQRRVWASADRSDYWKERHQREYVPVEVDRRGGARPGGGRPASYTTIKQRERER